MPTPKPTDFVAGSVRAIAEAVRTTFGAGVITIAFFGTTLITLAAGGSNLPPESRQLLMLYLIWVMTGLLLVLIALRVIRPSGLGGPPDPKFEENTLSKSHVNSPTLARLPGRKAKGESSTSPSVQIGKPD